MGIDSSVRQRTVERICGCLGELEEVVSITFVGSFIDSDVITSVSDIDIVVIVDKLSETIFREIEQRAGGITGAECGLPEYGIRLNMTFGPLKFNDPQTMVFHLMVYDVQGHRLHVEASPFTCCDWQRHGPVYGCGMDEVCTAAPLQLSDLISSRRSLSSYIADLESSSISYRKYVFEDGVVREEKHQYPVDERHRYEYAYHVLRYLMLNLLKILEQDNIKRTDQQLTEIFKDIWPESSGNLEFYMALAAWKREGGAEPAELTPRLEKFLGDIQAFIGTLSESAPRVTFIRHGRTPMNDGSFLGVGRDPSIVEDSVPQRPLAFDKLYSSRMKRTIETGNLYTAAERVEDARLNEIDYGKAEGMKFPQLKEAYPQIVADWLSGGDAPFPDGECQQDVARRLEELIAEEILPASKSCSHIGVVTHNVVIRALLGRFLQVPVPLWHKFLPGHLEEFSFLVIHGRLIPDFPDEQRQALRQMVALPFQTAATTVSRD